MSLATPGPPQQARSRATRARLLAATIESLVEAGYDRTSTTEVCRIAGVSQGALFKHFATKAQLLAAAVAQLFRDLIDRYAEEYAARGEGRDPVQAAVRLLWERFQHPHLQAAFELYGVARTDAELRAALRPALERHRENLRREAARLFPEAAADNPRFHAVVDLILDAMQGRALGALVAREPEGEAAMLDYLETLARRELGAVGARTDGDEGAARCRS